MIRFAGMAMVALSVVTGCCVTRPPRPFVPPPAMHVESLEPMAIANRILTSLLTISPIATETMVRLHVEETPDLAASPAAVAAMAALRDKLAAEPNVRLVSDRTAGWRLIPSIAAAPDGGQLLTLVMCAASDATQPVWQYRQRVD
jgi:hypothetical protein